MCKQKDRMLPPLGLCDRAEAYSLAARLLDKEARRPQSLPALDAVQAFLYCHATELAFKAFLSTKGVTERKLKRLGHNLKKCRREAERRSLADHVQMSEEEQAALAWLDESYSRKWFEYYEPGSSFFPHLTDRVAEYLNRLLAHVKPMAREAARS